MRLERSSVFRAEMRLDIAIHEMIQLAELLRRELDDERAERDYWREAAATTPIPRLVHSAGTKHWWWKLGALCRAG